MLKTLFGEDAEFRKELESLLNRYSKENGSNTPDFVLREYIEDSLAAFDKATKAREKFFGVTLTPRA